MKRIKPYIDELEDSVLTSTFRHLTDYLEYHSILNVRRIVVSFRSNSALSNFVRLLHLLGNHEKHKNARKEEPLRLSMGIYTN